MFSTFYLTKIKNILKTAFNLKQFPSLTLKNIHIYLFSILILFLPVNLGKHFIADWSYTRGLLVDYLIPTLFFQDILLVLLFGFWIYAVGISGLKKSYLINPLAIKTIAVFLLSILLSSLFSINIYLSLIYFARVTLYSFLVLYILGNFGVTFRFINVVKLFAVSISFLAVLGLMQWDNQAAVFDNYLVLGEQPYTASTRGVAIENVLGAAYIPSYGTFRHPNIFAGYLSIVLIWIFAYVQFNTKFLVPLVIGSFALFFTLSQIAWLSFALGLLFLLIKNLDRKTLFPVFIVAVIILVGLILPSFKHVSYEENPSFYRRANLLISGIELSKQNWLLGTGPGTNTLVIEEHLPQTKDLRFTQPVHNIFVLLFSEAGIVALGIFLYLIYLNFSKKVSLLFFISVLQFLVLGSFDHYILTIHQIQILFWLTLGFALTYNSIDYV